MRSKRKMPWILSYSGYQEFNNNIENIELDPMQYNALN